MPDPLAGQSDVETALLRPLTTLEAAYIDGLIEQASALLRTAAPSIDDRLARYTTDPTDKTAVSRGTVTAVVAGVVKRYLVNPNGIVNTSETSGPYAHSTSYALRGERETRGALQITPDDLTVLFPNRKRARVGTFRLTPALAPRPVGRYGPIPTLPEALEAVATFDSGNPQEVQQLTARFFTEELA